MAKISCCKTNVRLYSGTIIMHTITRRKKNKSILFSGRSKNIFFFISQPYKGSRPRLADMKS